MAKIIKFNILVGGKPCRSIIDIQKHFNIFDILALFTSGRLNKWARSRRLIELINQLDEIKLDVDAFITAKNLCLLFDVTLDDSELREQLTGGEEIDTESTIESNGATSNYSTIDNNVQESHSENHNKADSSAKENGLITLIHVLNKIHRR